MLNITRKGITSRWRLAVLGTALASAMLVIADAAGATTAPPRFQRGAWGVDL